MSSGTSSLFPIDETRTPHIYEVPTPQQDRIFDLYTVSINDSQFRDSTRTYRTPDDYRSVEVTYTFTPVATPPPTTFIMNGVIRYTSGGSKTLKSISFFLCNNFGTDSICVATTTTNILSINAYNLFLAMASHGWIGRGVNVSSGVMSYVFTFTDGTLSCISNPVGRTQRGGSESIGDKTITSASELNEHMNNLQSFVQKNAPILQSGGGRRRFRRKSRKNRR